MSDLTLTEVLARLGFTHHESPLGGLSEHDVMDDDMIVMTGTANDVWIWLREEGLHSP